MSSELFHDNPRAEGLERIAIGMGSNLGEREWYLEEAERLIRRSPLFSGGRVSGVIETEPVGGPAGSGLFLNCVMVGWWAGSAAQAMELLLKVETNLGRDRNRAVKKQQAGGLKGMDKNLPRTIDLDLLLLGKQVLEQDGLVLPHPRMHERVFVLGPLAEVAGDWEHPVLGRKVSQLYDQLLKNQKAAGAQEQTTPAATT